MKNENKRSLVVYIAGPYRSDTEFGVLENIRHAEKYALKYWKLGYTVICPHKNTAFFGGAAPDEFWLEGDLELLRRSDIVVFIPGWENSGGAKAEHEFSKECCKAIRYE